MPPPKIRGLGITQDAFTRRWHARGDVDEIGRLDAWGDTLLEAMEALQALARARIAEPTAGSDASLPTPIDTEPCA